MSRTATHVIVKLLEPVGPDDAPNVAEHIVKSLEFADVEWAQPCFTVAGQFFMVGEEMSCP